MNNSWPELKFSEWQETLATLHMWTQVVGKIRLKTTPLVNHWWNVPLYVSARGLTTSAMPYRDGRVFEIEFDFIHHQLLIKCSDGSTTTLPLRPQSVADFYAEVMSALRGLGMEIRIWTMPVEVPNPIRFEEDLRASYDSEYVNRFWRALVKMDEVLKEFRARFIGKVSPVHFFWGSFDLAVTRFSGKPAPEREGADFMTREAYSHEVISHGWWPKQTFYSSEMKEFFLLYDDVRTSASPEKALMDFCQSTYEAGANLAGWDRAALERE